jgi:SAM-dependent MidA family methyltransferase
LAHDTSWPQPSAEALTHSAELTRVIASAIAPTGWIDFARYMELALYAPGLGYYASGSTKLGGAGDFITAPELSPLFSRTLARQVAQLLDRDGDEVIELGAGSGRMARDLLLALAHSDALPSRYAIVEVSAELRARQQETMLALPEALRRRVHWLDELPRRITGLVLGNEVLDALPVHIVTWREDRIMERGVTWDGRVFSWAERPLAPGPLLDRARALSPPPPYVSEINLLAPALVSTLADALVRGALLFIDYGFGSGEYYHPQRDRGTLMCHYRHRAHDDPFFLPGLQDITSHVDFTSIAHAGVDAGLELKGYTTQAHFLINAGVTDLLAATSPADSATYLPLAAQAQKLLSPAEMGELFKVIALSRGIEGELVGFRAGDQRGLL